MVASGEKIRVLIVDDDAEMRENLKKLMSLESDIDVIGVASGGIEGVQMAIDLKPDIITMDINMQDKDGLTAASEITASHTRVAIIMLSVQHTQEYMRMAMRAGACDYLTKPPQPDELFGVIRQCYKDLPDHAQAIPVAAVAAPATSTLSGQDGYVVAVYSPKGGVGTTTTATSLAVGLSRRGAKVILVDTDLQFGDVGVFLNLRAQNTLADLPETFEEMPDVVNIMGVSHEASGLQVLLAPPRPEQADYVLPSSLKNLLEYLRTQYQYVIVDTNSVVNDALLSVVDVADRLVLLATPDIPALKNISVFFELLDQLKFPAEQTLFVVNRLRPGGISAERIEESMRRTVVGRIPDDPEYALKALNAADALVNQDHKRSGAARGMIELVKYLENEFVIELEEEAVEKQGGRLSWRS